MEDKKIKLVIFPVKITTYPNEYTERLKTEMFKEAIKIDPMTCVYRHWESTRYILDSVPTANIFK